jgi:hypothetical protein
MFMCFPLFCSNISLLMNYLGFATWLSIGAAVFCLPYLWSKCPGLISKCSCFFPCFFSNISLLMNYLGFATWLSIGAAVFCLPYLRWKCPGLT